MSHEAYSQLVSAYALGALDRDDRVRFEGHLRAGCPDCERDLVQYTETLGNLAAEAPPVAPPPAVRARLLERVATEPRAVRPTALARLAPLRRLAWPLAWAATVAAAAALVAYLTLTVADLRREVARRAAEATAHQVAVARLQKQVADLGQEALRQRELLALLSAPDARVITLAGLGPGQSARGRIWWRGGVQPGFFVTSGLPPAPPGKIYQLWVISAGTPFSGGIFAVDERGAGRLEVGPIPAATKPEVFAVTLEPAGGLPAPSGPMYLAAKLG